MAIGRTKELAVEDVLDKTVFERLNGSRDFALRSASSKDEAIDAGAGDDVVMTGSGDDIVKGGAGNDYIATGAGDDILIGGAGFNAMSGGSGRDTFVFDADDLGAPGVYALNTVTDFNPAQDCLLLIGFNFASFSSIPAFVSPTGVMLQIAPNKIILLQGVMSLDGLAAAVDLGQDPTPPPPVVIAALTTDTGVTNDGITAEISISGAITGGSVVSSLFLSIDGGQEFDVSAALNADGTFAIGADLLGTLGDGAHSFAVRAVDPAGQSSEVALITAVLDTVAPEITTLVLDPLSDTGIADDSLTKEALVTISGTSVSGATVSFRGQTVVADGNGRFSFANVALEEGENFLPLVAVDEAGNTATSVLAISRDTVGPLLDGLSLAPSSDAGVVGDGKTVVGAALIILGRTEAHARVTLGDVVVVADESGSFSIDAGAAALGANVFILQATDAAGNVTEKTFAVVGEVPKLPVPDASIALVNDTGDDGTDRITGDLALAGTVSIAPARLTLALGDGPAFEITHLLKPNNSFSVSQAQLEELFGPIPDGEIVFTIVAENAEGVAGAVGQVTATYDTTPPSVTLELQSVSDSGAVGDGLTNKTLVDFTGVASGTTIVSFNGADVAVRGDGTFALSAVSLVEGVNELTVSAEDLSGNVSTQVLTVTVDTVAPALSDLALDVASDTGELGDNTTDLRNVTLTGQAEPGSVVSIGDLSTVAAGDGSFNLTGVPVAVGENILTLSATDAAGNSRTATLRVEGTEQDVGAPPVIQGLRLTLDTGVSLIDKITSNSGLTGTLTSDDNVTALFLSVDGGTPLDVSEALSGAGFAIGADLVAVAAGGSTPDGAFTVTVTARDAEGRSSAPQALTATLDTTAPVISGLALAASSDTGLQGDGITALRSVRLVGEGEPGSTVTSGAASTIVEVDGRFALNGVAVAQGDNSLSLIITDKAGNSSESVLVVTGIQAVSGQPVLVWNDITLEAIADNAETPTGASRVLAMQSVAVYDVVAAIDDAPAFLVSADAAEGADLTAAIAQASHAVLSYAFPAFQAELDAYLAAALADVPDGAGKDAGIALGQTIAERVIYIREADGWDDFEPVAGSDVIGQWRETAPMFTPTLDPQWATMDTWALSDQDQFRPDAPPSLSSAEYAEALASVQSIGSATSTTRTADQTQAARFWKDGFGTETPPGHWNSIATDLMMEKGTGTGEAARALAVLNVSMADAFIAAWDAKYTYKSWRPETAIHLADEDGNASTTADETWAPLMITPAHPDYVSGHATTSGAAAEVLTRLFGPQSFTTDSTGLVGVTRSFDSFWDAAEEAANSREWGGIHFSFANEAGLLLGASVADWAISEFNDQTDTAAPVIIVDVSFAYVGDLPFEIKGTALDTLSGVESLTASVNGATPVALTLQDNGGFSFSFGVDVADGTYELALVATDASGNTSRPVKSTIVFDTADPELTLTSLTDGALSGPAARLTGTIDGTGAPIVALAYQIEGGEVFTLSFNQATGAFDSALNLSAVGQGTSTVTVIAADAAGNSIRKDFTLTIDEPIPFVVTELMPDNLSAEVGSTFRPEVHFSRPVDPATVTSNSFFLQDASGKTLAANVRVSADGLKAWLFPSSPMPGANTITVTLRSDLIKAVDGIALDGDADGAAGGNFTSRFTTVSTTAIPNTSISGYVVDPGNDLKPMTFDDFSVGRDGIDYTSDDVFKSPIKGATVFILGLEGNKVVTDERGYFELTNVPAGNVKIAIDGRTATNAPEGVFWPEMVMDANILPGRANTLMAAMNTGEQRDAVAGRGEVYLPRISEAILQDLSETEDTEIGMPASAAQDLTAEQREAIKLVIKPGSAVDEHGNPVENAQVGISTVPAALVMDMLPPGLMQHTFDLTIQAPSSAVFTTPAELTVPNVFNAAPGTKLNVLSFDHTTGRLVIEGTATVSADGKTVTTDPGTGITKPGWHGFTPSGSPTKGGEPPVVPVQPPPEPPKEPCEEEPNLAKELEFYTKLAADIADCIAGLTKTKLVKSIAEGVALVASCAGDTLAYVNSLDDAVKNYDPSKPDNDAAILDALSAVIAAKDLFRAKVPQAVKEVVEGFNQAKVFFDVLKLATGLLAAACDNAIKEQACKEDKSGWDRALEYGLAALCSVVDSANAYVRVLANIIDQVEMSFSRTAVELVLFAIDASVESAKNFVEAEKDPGSRRVQNGFEIGTSDSTIFDTESFVEVDPKINVLTKIAAARQDLQALKSDFDQSRPLVEEVAADLELRNDLNDKVYSDLFALVTHGLSGYLAHAFYSVDTGEQVVRGQTDALGRFEVFLPASTDITVRVFEAERNLYAETTTRTAQSGENTTIPALLVRNAETLLDSDFDGVADVAESVIGTSVDSSDTDGDGLSDGFEIENSLDPLSGFVTTTGLLDTVPLSGSVAEIVITADVSGQGTIALVASGSAGLSILDLSERTSPRLLAQLDTQGSAVDVAVDGQLALAAVATASRILIVDVSTPDNPRVIANIGESVSHIEIESGRLYAADDGEILVYDIFTGDRLQRQDLPTTATSVRAMTMESGLLYVIDSVNTLSVYDVVDDLLNLRGTLSLAGQSWASGLQSDKLFASNGVLYVPADAGFNAGYATIDISNFANMRVLSGPDDRGLSGTDFADAGNGIGITVGRLGGVFGTNSVMVVDNSDPTQTGQFVTRFDLAAAPTVTVVSAGFVYVGDAAGNFHVINALGFDTDGVAPTIELGSLDIDADPSTEGIQIEEGTEVRLPITISDDVQIQKVELLINGAVVRTDLSFPYDLKFRVPNLADGVTQGTFQVRATDTGGNITVSDAIQFDIIEDITPPEIIRLTPNNGGLTLVDGTTVRVVFNEAIDTSSLSRMLASLEDAGGQSIEAVTLSILGSDRIVQFDFGTLDLGVYTLSVDLNSVTDLAGNSVGGAVIIQTLEVVDATAVWTAPGGGNWSDISKWRDGVLPADTDGVALVLNEGSTVIHRNLSTEVERIVLTGTLDLQSGSLQAGLIEGNNGVFRTSGGTLNDTEIDGSSNFAALITGGTWSNVDLLVDGFVGDGSQFVQWFVRGGLTVEGELELTGGNQSAYMYLQGAQTVDGSGTLRLNDQRSYVQLQSQSNSLAETVVFGPDLSIEGQGQVWVSDSTRDRFKILGDVTAVGGQLSLQYVDNAGEVLSLDSAGGGWISLGRVDNTVLDVADGADVRLQDGSTRSNITLGGAGSTRIQNATVNGLTVSGFAEIEGVSANSSGQLYVNEDLTVGGVLSVAGTQQGASYLYLNGEQSVDGSGEILLSRANAIGGEALSGRNYVQLQSRFSGERETLTFGEDLTLRGDGTVTTNSGEDRIRILGEAVGIAGGALILERLDNAGETLNVNATAGAVRFRSLVENTVVNGTGEVGLEANVRIEDVTFNMDARIGGATGYDYAYVEDGLTLNASLELASGTDRQAYLFVNGSQTIGGTGSIDLTRSNAPSGNFTNTISLQSQSAAAEVLTFGAGIEITGTGRLEAGGAEDRLQILGTVIGRDGALTLTDIDNQGATLRVDASDGDVILSGRIENTVFDASAGQTGKLTIGAGATLDAVTLNIDTQFGGSYPQSFVENGLTLNRDLEIAADPNAYAYLYFSGEQVIGGTGAIRLSDANAPLSNNQQNYVYLSGQIAGSEIVTIGADMEITGEGLVWSGDNLDEFLVEGAVVADNGLLHANDIAALEGTLGATADGELYLGEGIELTERGTLAVGLSGSGADVMNGLIRVNGALEQKGTLALDIAAGFVAEIGDEFVILTATEGFTGAFDDFQGFDLDGNKAFELIQKDENTLAIRVTTDDLAFAFSSVDHFDFGFV